MAATEARPIVGGRSDVGELDANEESRAIATLEEGDEERDEPHGPALLSTAGKMSRRDGERKKHIRGERYPQQNPNREWSSK